MRYLLSIFFVILSLSLQAQTTYYIDPAGTDGAGISGDVSHPFKTLAYACTRTSSGDEVHVNEGDFYETAQAIVPLGVDIVGEGEELSILHYTLASSSSTNGCILLSSAVEGTNGNQTIAYLTIDGSNLAASYAISNNRRSNVTITHCTVQNFEKGGICLRGTVSFGAQPTTYATGNEISYCTISNCATRVGGTGLIRMGGQDDLEIMYCTLTQNQRASGYNGNIIDGVEGYYRRFKYHHNVSTKDFADTRSWNFHLEMWTCRGEFQCYENQFLGGGTGVDYGGVDNVKGTYAYSAWFHHNTFEWAEQLAYGEAYTGGMAITMEGTCEDVIVEFNYAKNLAGGFSCVLGQTPRHMDNIRVRYNILENIGYEGGGYTFAFIVNSYSSSNYIQDIYYDNNVVIGGGLRAILFINSDDLVENIHFRNNVAMNATVYGWLTFWDGTGIIRNIYVQNNDIYNNVNNNAIYYRSGKSVTNLVQSNNLYVNPVFTSSTDFHLQSVSPLIDRGLDVGLTVDYDSVSIPIGSAPDIGAYEYGVPSPAIDPTVVSTTRPYWTSPTTATSGGYVTDDGGGTVTARGICWSTSNYPTLSDAHTSNGSGTGAYTSFMTGLNDDLLYYVRAYATNEAGTSYGAQLTFRSSQVIRNKEVVVIHNGKIINIQ